MRRWSINSTHWFLFFFKDCVKKKQNAPSWFCPAETDINYWPAGCVSPHSCLNIPSKCATACEAAGGESPLVPHQFKPVAVSFLWSSLQRSRLCASAELTTVFFLGIADVSTKLRPWPACRSTSRLILIGWIDLIQTRTLINERHERSKLTWKEPNFLKIDWVIHFLPLHLSLSCVVFNLFRFVLIFHLCGSNCLKVGWIYKVYFSLLTRFASAGRNRRSLNICCFRSPLIKTSRP